MLLQIDGFSGSGKSVLVYLLDQHPDVYSHPFHDLIQMIAFGSDWKENEWVKHHDILGLRNALCRSTEYYKTENYIRQNKYAIQFKSGINLMFDMDFNFSSIDDTIIKNLKNLSNWNPENLITTFYKVFDEYLNEYYGERKYYSFMGPWRINFSMNRFHEIFPNGKRIVVKRDLKDLIAIKTGRIPHDLDFRSQRSHNFKFNSFHVDQVIRNYNEYFENLNRIESEHNKNILTIDFEDLIFERKKTLSLVYDFLEIDSFEKDFCTFLGEKIDFEGINYADVKFDNFTKLLSTNEINYIEKQKQFYQKVNSNPIKENCYRIKRFLNRVYYKNN